MTTSALRAHRRLLVPIYDWPDRIRTGVERVTRLAEVRLEAPAITAHEVIGDLAAKMLDAPDPTKLDVASYRKAQAAEADLQTRHAALTRARELAEQELSNAVHDCAPELLANIRAAGEDTWRQITDAVATLDGIEVTSTEAVMRAGDQARQAWLILGELSDRCHQLRACLGQIPWDDESVELDTRNDHREFRRGNCQVLGPNWHGQAMADRGPKMPWDESDTTGRSRVVWLCRNAGEAPWWPSPSEQESAWREVHAEQSAAMSRQQQAHAAVHAR